MVFLGVMGEYLGRTYLQVNKKPQTLVRETLNLPEREGLGFRDPARNPMR
jgi:hypothetical protein